jgi:hypothetical protein
VLLIMKALPFSPLKEDEFWKVARYEQPHWFFSDFSN